MAGTIEAFVEKLQAEGVEAGRTEAEKIRTEAERKAAAMIQEAETRAHGILDKAAAECRVLRARTETELRLAARDTVVRLRETLTRALRYVLDKAVRDQLAEPTFLEKVLHDVIMAYVKADVAGDESVTINVAPEMREKLAAWAVSSLQAEAQGQGVMVNLVGTLKAAGFEYQVTEGTVDVTAESVVSILSELVGPELRRLLAEAGATT
ncbi:MAG TPA: hypothetical protein PKY77_14510 [Phycisphaerae bacterium]|nr:hypothetical protein [Phycisphaerae bacterium]HRY67467.1 hypothetical protein [Phycisphaerae bacterium]HSA27940.1 hypothetical protein [Phycisphaerae bacterium]